MEAPGRRAEFPEAGPDILIAAALFAFAFALFLWAPIHDVMDSAYSMLASESLLKHGTFTLDATPSLRVAPKLRSDYVANGDLYTLEVVDGHITHFFPPGSVVLAVPFVAAFNAVGISAANPDGTYSPDGERRIESTLAAFLMAALAAVFFLTARLCLSRTWSVVIAAGGAFGTQIFSTASRVLWADTWGTLLLAIALFLLLRSAILAKGPNGAVLATLLAWLYFAKPTYAVAIAGVTAYVFFRWRKTFIPYATTGALWAGLFFLYSWSHFHRLLPSYYRASRLDFGTFGTAFAGNLISPGRGLFVYVPVLLFVAYLLARYRRHVEPPGIAFLALTVSAVHLLLIASFSHWWGGYSYGPRMSTGLVPWFVLLAVLGIRARESGRTARGGAFLELSAGALLLFASIAINTLGATDRSTAMWNQGPQDIDRHPERNWDFRHPQFLARFLPPPGQA